MSTIVPLFTTLLQKLNYNPPKDLIDYINQYYQQNKYTIRERSSRLGWQSSPHTIQQLQPVYDYIKQHIYLNCNIILGKAWINVNHQGAYNVTHIHPNCDYTFVYYITDSKAAIVLQAPNMFERFNHLASVDKQYKQQYGMTTEYTVYPSMGDILVFPSYVPHRVEPNSDSSHRISLSFGGNCIDCKEIAPRQ